MRGIIIITLTTLALFGCVSTKEQAVYVTEAIDTKREIALVGIRHPWVNQIEMRLRKEGVKIKRFASVSQVTERISRNKKETYNEASTRLILVLDGFAPNTVMTRCLGGGYKFNYINAELIDALNNETIANYANSGYSEGCPPLSGTIFQDVTSMVLKVVK